MENLKIGYVEKDSIIKNLCHVLQTNQDFNEEPIPSSNTFIYRPFDISHIQNYNPYLPLFFPHLEVENLSTISFHHRNHVFDLHTIVEINNNSQVIHKKSKNIFVKFSPLLDPIHYMTGKYDFGMIKNITILPNGSNHELLPSKIRGIHNASYVDNFFNFLSSLLLNQHKFVHGIDYYGSLLCVQKDYKINVEDDLEYIHNHIFFQKNNGKLFFVENFFHDVDGNHEEPTDSRGKFSSSPTLQSGEHQFAAACEGKLNGFEWKNDNDTLIDIEIDTTLDCPPVAAHSSVQMNELEEIYQNANVRRGSTCNRSINYNSSDSSYTSASSTTTNPKEGDDVGYGEMEEEEEEDPNDDNKEYHESDHGDMDDEYDSNDSSGSGSIEDTSIHAYIKDFPVQMIFLEKCEGTLDELFENDLIDEDMGISVLFQIIMSLLTYQIAFDFTHNDLHTNNIMYVCTEHKYIYYKYDGQIYRVPTNGKIFKMIDFGRAIYRVGPHSFCSDSFAEEGDANTQYNFGPFCNPRKQVVMPNKSFDLCRLGCSIYDFIINKHNTEPYDEFQTVISEWCQDEQGKNLIYKKNGKDRYPGFKLYRVIAHKVFQHTPHNQLQRPVFRKFLWHGKIKANAVFFDLDLIRPCYHDP
jgi:hypothetical protein